ncbi:putative odorant receptor 69a [Musca vetustissima]|uniref:putative odorant receptor 69a n=1 Tax=Musca vetustissima TaxID=27455 RepID=UPI002AB6A3D0|nr:putative odorant receptor 69a [Musca vetustissima]
MYHSYRLQDFMIYPNIALTMALVQPFDLNGGTMEEIQTASSRCRGFMKSVLIKVWFVFGVVNLIYQNVGMLAYLLLPQLSEIFDDVEFVAKISETCGIMGLTIVAVCKMFVIFWHGGRISMLLQELQEIFPGEHEQFATPRLYRVHHFAKYSQQLMGRTMKFFIFAFCVYNSLPIGGLLYEVTRSDGEVMYRYQSNTWYPWQTKDNTKTWWNFAACYLCQVQSSLTGVGFIMAGEFMLCFFITQMQMHFDYLTNALASLDAATPRANTKLKYLIIYHTKLLRYSKEINDIFNISFLVNFITSSIAICMMACSMVMLSMIHTVKYSVGLLSFLVFTFFICYNGEEFTEASDAIMPSAFYNNWYEGNAAYRRMILFFILRSGESNVLRAYKFTTVSLPTFMAILKFSYQLFTFLQAMD